tara:strand:+ start:1770 stop:2378 length:609 start_codon:yes stop_codon:yes gene_type:complete
MNTKDIFLNTQFSKSAISVKDLPSDIGSEISLCGRSNSGKSSVLNTLASNKKLAKTSKTPGRTQAMNVFSLNSSSENRIIDLPGYGFANVSKDMRKEWGRIINQYLNYRKSLKGIVIIMDIRHSFRDSDLSLIEWSIETHTPVRVLLNKADKIPKNKVITEVRKGNHFLKKLNVFGDAQAFSAKSLIGVDELKVNLLSWLEI